MARFNVWSKFDGVPLPARNERERDYLLEQGHHAEDPYAGVVTNEAPDPNVAEEAGDAIQAPGTDSGNLSADDKPRRVRRPQGHVANGTLADGEVPAAEQQRDGTD